MRRHACSTLASLLTLALAAGCGSSTVHSASGGGSGGHTGSASSGTGSASSGSGGSGGTTAGGGPYADLPAAPILDGLSPSLPGLFGVADVDGGAGPCLAEPTLDAMVPRNWTPLRFEWSAPAEENVFELRVHVEGQLNDLVVYTAQNTYAFDASTWHNLTAHSFGKDLAITLRGAGFDNAALTAGPSLGASGVVHLAPVDAPGTVVYWTSSDGTAFKGFKVGDTASTVVLTPSLAGNASNGPATTCVACHASSPDGKLLLYTRDGQDGSRAVDARMVADAALVPTGDISPAALQLLNRTKQTAPVLSAAHYGPDDSVAVSVFQEPTLTQNQYQLIWTDLHAASTDNSGWGIIPRTVTLPDGGFEGDPRQAASPSWRHDGTAIAYVSAPNVGEGVIASGSTADPDYDIYVVPYGNRQGGAAQPLEGASSPDFHEFYPVYSPGDSLVAFDRTDQPVDSYDEASAEVCVVPASGGVAVRLRANDPPACTGHVSPGITNSWARWAPSSALVDGHRYYWLVFSSKRRDASHNTAGALIPQLYIAAIVTTVNGASETLDRDYPALYVTSQDPAQSNHTPAWDVFELR